MKTKRSLITRPERPRTVTDRSRPHPVSRMVDPMKAPAPGNRLPFRRGSVEYCLGTEADHEAVYQTLLHVFHGPDRDSFLGAINDPVYRPDQRILAKVDGRIVSHLHLTERQVRFGSVTIPVNGVMWVGTLPEFRGMGFAQNLMRLASERGKESGVAVQVLTTGMPQFYQRARLGDVRAADDRSDDEPEPSPGQRRGGRWPRSLARAALAPGRARRLDVALRAAIRADHRLGRPQSEEYWRWMIGRRYAHVIWVACQGEAVKGYAFIKDHKILEIAFDPAYPQALRALLGRVRAEALERAYPEVSVAAPGESPGDRRDSCGLRARDRSGRLRRLGVDVPHPRPGPVLEDASSPSSPVASPRRKRRFRSSWGSARTTSAG